MEYLFSRTERHLRLFRVVLLDRRFRYPRQLEALDDSSLLALSTSPRNSAACWVAIVSKLWVEAKRYIGADEASVPDVSE
jgi:hypothetical protein